MNSFKKFKKGINFSKSLFKVDRRDIFFVKLIEFPFQSVCSLIMIGFNNSEKSEEEEIGHTNVGHCLYSVLL